MDRSPREVVVALFTRRMASRLTLGHLTRELRAECPELNDDLQKAQAALEDLYTEGLLKGEHRGPLHYAELVLPPPQGPQSRAAALPTREELSELVEAGTLRCTPAEQRHLFGRVVRRRAS